MVFVKTISITLQIGDTDSATAKLKTPMRHHNASHTKVFKGPFFKICSKIHSCFGKIIQMFV